MKQPLSAYLGLSRSIVGLLTMVILLGLGEKTSERFLPVYLLALGGGAEAVGLFQALINWLGAFYAWPAGYLSDRVGIKKSLLIFNLIAVSGYALVIVATHWWMVAAAALMFMAWSTISLPASMALVADALPATKRTMGVAMHSLVRRIPMALGPLLGGLLIAQLGEVEGVRAGFIVAIALAALGAFVQQKLIVEEGRPADARIRWHSPWQMYRAMQPELKKLLLSDILIRFCEQIPYAFVVIWCMKLISQPVTALQFGVLTSIEMVTSVLIYLPIAHFADRSRKEPFVLITFAFFTAFPLVLLVSHSFWPLAGAFMIRGLKEFGEPSRKALIVDLCPDKKRATMFGFYYFVRDTLAGFAAALGAVFWQISPAGNLIAAAACGALGALIFLNQANRATAGPPHI